MRWIDRAELTRVCARILDPIDELVIRVKPPSIAPEILRRSSQEPHMERLQRYNGTCIAHHCEIAECTALILCVRSILSRPLACCEPQRRIETGV